MIRLLLCLLLAVAACPVPAAPPPDYDAGIASVRQHISGNDLKAAKEELRSLLVVYPGNPEVQGLLGRVLFWQKKFDEAAIVLKGAAESPSSDVQTRALYIEALLATGGLSKAREAFYALPDATRSALSRERGDLVYRLLRNYVKLSGSYWTNTNGGKDERDYTVEVSQGIGNLTVVLTGAYVSRFGLHDSIVGCDLYSPLGKGTGRWGYVSLWFSPDAEFLPTTTLAAEVYQGLGPVELSLGYRRSNYRAERVDVFTPGITVYLPHGLSLNAKVPIVPKNNGATLLVRLFFEPDHRFKAMIGGGAGTISERLESIVDFVKRTTYSGLLNLEYRWNPHWSAGGEASVENRQGVNTKYGLNIFSRFWW